ncbi:uracil-DNA glycosylase [Burkholderia ubonensis]|uniref:Type-4 uracil-DNA glycosylase n=1 Tax=Burkholderia ubonensis subsp. mesacidophila TaxID=265293 RepID=A0A2A4ESV2_9BURK|nr:uracil-DNA glycosylase [Burkholderia ubonensis]PCE24231.1 uracil-DNA glycosylase [Burkholderia ubonensis subsp. mesacidophila]
MALAEAALEEMGLAQIWVRRGLHAADVPAAAAQDVVTKAPEAAPAGRAGEGGAARSVVSEPVASVAVTPAVDAPTRPLPPSARANAPEHACDAGESPAATQPPEARAQSVAGEHVASRHVARTDDVAPPADARPLEEDDFAWFDAAPPADLAPVADLRAAETPVAELDWDALAARVADCTRCRLCEKRTNTVFGVGDRAADWMLVGEAPGENEDKQGEPFVGQAGKLLDNMLQSLSLARGTNVYIANVIKCRPPGNRNPEPDEVARCEPYLQRQVALVKPKLIVALGRFAAQTLLKTDASIASLRGRVHTYEGVPVIVTYHPAYLLRSLQDKSKAWADLCLARDTFRGTAIRGADERSEQ